MIESKSAKKLLFKSGRIIDPFTKKTFNGDILVENGKISKISDSISSRGKDLPMGLLKANHLIEQDCVHYDDSVKIDNGDFLQGSPLCNYLVSKLKSSLPLTSIYNRLGFDFGTISGCFEIRRPLGVRKAWENEVLGVSKL